MTSHECVFVEEQEPSARLILTPCLVCGTTAMDALDQLRRDVDRLAQAITNALAGGYDDPRDGFVITDHARELRAALVAETP